jgi:hypothetical protein
MSRAIMEKNGVEVEVLRPVDDIAYAGLVELLFAQLCLSLPASPPRPPQGGATNTPCVVPPCHAFAVPAVTGRRGSPCHLSCSAPVICRRRPLGFSVATLGNWTVKTPFANVAAAFSASTPSGSGITR